VFQPVKKNEKPHWKASKKHPLRTKWLLSMTFKYYPVFISIACLAHLGVIAQVRGPLLLKK